MVGKNMRRIFLRRILKWLRYHGTNRYCPVCENNAKRFSETGVDPRPDAVCPQCRSSDRDRLSLIFINHKTNLFNGQSKRMLHVAPEPCLKPLFEMAPEIDCLSADIFRTNVMERMDITDIQHPDPCSLSRRFLRLCFISHRAGRHQSLRFRSRRQFFRQKRLTGCARTVAHARKGLS